MNDEELMQIEGYLCKALEVYLSSYPDDRKPSSLTCKNTVTKLYGIGYHTKGNILYTDSMDHVLSFDVDAIYTIKHNSKACNELQICIYKLIVDSLPSQFGNNRLATGMYETLSEKDEDASKYFADGNYHPITVRL